MDFKKNKRSTYTASPAWYLQASIATISTAVAKTLLFPLESTKFRLQLTARQGYQVHNTIRDSIKHTLKNAGFTGLYRGLGLSLLREIAYLVPKAYAYEEVKNYFAADIEKVGYYRRVCPILAATGAGLAVCNILDIVRIKYITDGAGKPHRSVREILSKLRSKDGFSITNGLILNFFRHSVFIGAEVAGYEQTKLLLIKKFKLHKDDTRLHAASSVAAGFLASVVTTPFDVVRTRYMSQLGEELAQPNVFRTVLDMVRNESLKNFYKGFTPFLLKTIPSSFIFFTLSENLKGAYLKSSLA